MIVFLLMFSITLHAQEKTLDINVTANPGIPVVGESWTLTLFVDYHDPDDVFVSPPYSEALSLDRILKTPRVTGNKVQTVIEYRFTPKKSGRFILEKFTVVCPEGSVQIDPIVLDIRANIEEKVSHSFQLDWEIDSPIRQGERTILTLRGWDSQLPPPNFFLPQTPPGLILALSPEQERKNNIAAKFIIIPLETGDYLFEARFLQYENINFNIPALQINVTSIINSHKLNNPEARSGLENDINFIEIVDSSAEFSTEFSDDSANKRILQRRFFFLFSILIIILVIITPLVCLFLFVRKK
jgi:hypothetical protein